MSNPVGVITRDRRRVPVSLLLVVGLSMATSQATVFAADGHALSDVSNIQVAGDIDCPKTGIPRASSAAVADSVDNATARLDKALRTTAKPGSLRALTESPEVRDPAAASNLAAVALADHLPQAALALLLHANKTAPKDPMTSVNLAALSNYLGNYQDAYTVASAAEKLPGAGTGNVRSSLLVNKGHALLGLGRPQEAQAALDAALKLAPDLPEAYTTMAYAMGDQGKCSQAVRFLRAGAFRHPPKDVVDAALYAKADIDPDKPSPADLIRHLPVKASVDMSRGRSDSLPRMTYGTNYADVRSAWEEWQTGRMETYKKQWTKAKDEEKRSGMAAAKAHVARKSGSSLSAELTAKRAEYLLSLLSDELGTHTAEYPKLAEAEKKMEAEVGKINADANDAFEAKTASMMREFAACKSDSACSRRVEIAGKTQMCAVMNAAIGREGAALRQFELQARNYYGDIYHRATAVAANFSEPAYHQYASAMIDSWRYGFYMRLRPVGLGTWYTADLCTPAKSELPDVQPEPPRGPPSTCQVVGNKTKVTAKAGVLSVGVGCEKVEAKVATPGPLDVFLQAEYVGYNPTKKLTDPKERFVERSRGGDPDKAPNLRQWGAAFDGKLTIYGGVEGTASKGGLSTTANAGVSVTIDGLGNIGDAEGKTGRSTSVGVAAEAGGFGVGVETELSSGSLKMPSFVTAPSGLGVFPD